MDSTLTVKGQVTIPKAAREHLGVKAGDRVRFFLHPNGALTVLPLRPPSASRGMFKARRHVTIEEMKKAVRAKAAEHDRRSKL